MFQGLFIDGFAGGGGASTGIAQAIGREVDIAVNHSETAIAIHRANHPTTTHFCQDIKALWPRAATRMQPVAGAWFSPDCKEFSKAKGGPVKDRSIRALCWEVVHWLDEVRPAVGYLENVEEFEYAAPLGTDGMPVKGAEGREFRRFVKAIRRLGYRVQWRLLRACDYGAPTSRKRLYMVMRCDGLPIRWPKPTHGAPTSPGVRRGRLLPWRTAAECIDWSIPCPSIFDRARPLKPATLRRIAHGVMRYVVHAAEPFIVPPNLKETGIDRCSNDRGSGSARNANRDLADSQRNRSAEIKTHFRESVDNRRTLGGRNHIVVGESPMEWSNEVGLDVALAPHVTKFRSNAVGASMAEPAPTVTANGGAARPAGATPLGLVGATLIGVGGRRGQSPPMPVTGSYPTTTAKADVAIATAHLAPFVSYGQHGGANQPSDKPHHTIAASPKDTNGVVTAFLSSFYSQGSNNRAADRPHPTVMAESGKSSVVCAHVEQANTGMVGHTPRRPLSTIVGKGCTQRIVETTMIEEGALPPAMMQRAVEVAAFLVKYYGSGGDNEASQSQPLDRPLDAITTRARFAVVTVTIDATTYVIVDIGLRMLKPRELANAQGFPPGYVLDPVCWYTTEKGNRKHGPLPTSHQISAIGNSVCPPVARALVTANQPGIASERIAA